MYLVTVSYPDGHVEDIFEEFQELKPAVQYGLDLLNQVRATEQFKDPDYKEDEFGFAEAQEAYFYVTRVDDEGRKIVFDSRGM